MSFRSHRTLVKAQTDAATSAKFQVKSTEPVTLMANNLATTEEVDIEISPDGGTSWFVYKSNGAAVVLTATNTAIRLNGPAVFRVKKDATAGACGVFLASDRDI